MKNAHILIASCFLLFAGTSMAQNIFVFEQTQNPSFITQGVLGECYEVDAATKGEKYKMLVTTNFCRPQRVSYEWKVIPPLSGNCFEVGAHNWIKLTSSQSCKPMKTAFQFDRLSQQNYVMSNNHLGMCYEVDMETLGSKYKVPADISKCRPGAFQYKKLTYLGTEPACYEVSAMSYEDQALFFRLTVGANPEQFKHVWIAETNAENCQNLAVNDGARSQYASLLKGNTSYNLIGISPSIQR